MSEYLVTNGTERSGSEIDVVIRDGRIDRVEPAGTVDPSAFDTERRYDADGSLVTPTFSEPHTHLDTAFTVFEAPPNDSGTVEEGWDTWAAAREELTTEVVKRRARKNLKWFVTNGVTRVRTHVDVTASHWAAVEALLSLRAELEAVDLELIAFPIDSVVDDEETLDQVRRALEMGVDIVGGLPHKERTRERGVEHVRRLVEVADEHDARMDFHIDETDDPGCRFTEVLADEAHRRGIGDRATASHATALHSYPNAYANKLVHTLARTDVNVVTNPLANAIVQGRYDDYPRRRGHTRVEELREAGVTVGIGQDSVMDSTYQYGDGDPLKSAYMLAHFAHMNRRRDLDALWDMLTHGNAAVFGAENYGLREGDEGSLVVFDSPDQYNALRTQPPRELVLKAGRPVATGRRSADVRFGDTWTDVAFDHTG